MMQHPEPRLIRHIRYGILAMLFVVLVIATLCALFWTALFFLNVVLGRLS